MKGKVLVIDDDQDMCAMIKDFLEKEEFTVETLSQSKESLKTAIRYKPNLIILDIEMPDFNGFEVLTSLKTDKRTLATPVVMLTARGDDEAKIESAGSYCEDYLVKPVRLADLKAKVDEILNRRNI